MRKIDIYDTTLRDGEQSPGVNLNTAEKLEIAKQLERLGMDIIEAGFPAASLGDLDAVRKIASTVKDSSVTGLARCVKSDIDAAWEALKVAECPRLHVFLATSPIHMTHKLKQTPEQVVETAVESIKYAKQFFPVVQWSAEDAFRSDPAFLAHIVEQAIKAGATIINLPDTVGYATPQEYGAMFKYMKDHVPNVDAVKLSSHCHNDLGMAVANTLAAIENGADQVEGTINGIGERAGNVALEEVAVALYTRKDAYDIQSGLTLNEIKRTSQLVSQLTGMAIQANKAVVGKNAFAHESGIHQDGVLKEPTTYEIITPELIGEESNNLVLGKHSGRHAFNDRAKSMGFELDKEALNQAFKEFKQLADRKKEITSEDLWTILTQQQLKDEDAAIYELESVQVHYGTEDSPMATARVKVPDGRILEDACNGAGSVEAIFNTLERIIDGKVHVLDYRVSSIGKGRDALGEAVINLTFNGEEFTGRGAAQDVLEASAKAYLNAINRNLLQSKMKQLISTSV
ncbi:2-isopropylmalate synthase [Siminovitchia fortis]|uniref:2-isopropylmalate synthase n=1 Tax=Siminovitchia fortis TaxID=254758 RepID=A0A443IZD5_9BACI|nr:2-isopropylmalate synthase [Siminovitchia fortis]RWR13504.1 2-isopropylmalate synthase [Siminovitchia fortis]WHY81745.1 2-isopropylmalate synthase [Siminovitchia fortis]